MRGHRRSLLLALVLCCVSAVALAGIYKREKGKEDNWDPLVDLSEVDASSLPSEEEVSALVKGTEQSDEGEDSIDTKETDRVSGMEDIPTEDTSANVTVVGLENMEEMEETNEMEQQEAMAQIAPASLDFDESTILTWPVQGEVLMEYSMDKTVYFPTLQQYKYNPGLLIQGEEGTMVYAGADGVVKKIEQSDELGLTVTIDLGNSYEVTYGQLKALNVEEGSGVSDGSFIGLVAAPTKYYSVEGDHVYMELKKDGQPIDPLDFLD